MTDIKTQMTDIKTQIRLLQVVHDCTDKESDAGARRRAILRDVITTLKELDRRCNAQAGIRCRVWQDNGDAYDQPIPLTEALAVADCEMGTAAKAIILTAGRLTIAETVKTCAAIVELQKMSNENKTRGANPV